MGMSQPVSTLIRRKWHILKVEASTSVAEAASMMRDHNVGSLLVIGPTGRLAGIVTERDILGKVVAALADPSETDVESIMTRDVVTVDPNTSLDQAQELMGAGHLRHLPVISDGLPLGMVSARDLMEHKLHVTESMAQQQAELLHALENNYPGITQVHRDPANGRVVI
jgi:CBS domain-containing protein